MKKISIKVFQELENSNSWNTATMKFIETIKCKPFNKGFVGNFVPHWCKYKGKNYLIRGSIDYSYMHGYDNDAYIILPKIKE